jgi:hypothetical protein
MHSASTRQVRRGRLPGETALMCRPILTSASAERGGDQISPHGAQKESEASLGALSRRRGSERDRGYGTLPLVHERVSIPTAPKKLAQINELAERARRLVRLGTGARRGLPQPSRR